MERGHWTYQTLDEMRGLGDPTADQAVAELFAGGEVGVVHDLMKTLVRDDGIPSEQLPPVICRYLSATAEVPEIDPAKVARGQELFGLFGPEILMVLGFYGLPADYAAKKGVQVLYRTAYLVQRPIRRVFETTQMVMDVMAEGGLGPEGRGVRSAQKVRLMHAAVRHLITHDAAAPWDDALGVPINQEDMAGTLMTFSYLVLDGLRRLGVHLSDEDQDAYLHAWRVIGQVMGIQPALIPAGVAEARALTELIHRRQIAASPEGRALTAALVEGYQGLLPAAHLRGAPASFLHFFLDRGSLHGAEHRRDAGGAARRLDRAPPARRRPRGRLAHPPRAREPGGRRGGGLREPRADRGDAARRARRAEGAVLHPGHAPPEVGRRSASRRQVRRPAHAPR